MPEKKLKVLLIAEAANPEWTSVPLIGWFHAVAISRVCDAHLVTQVRNQAAIERAGWQEGKQFTAINSEKVIAPLYKISTFLRGGKSLGWTITTAIASIAYPYFEYCCWKKFRKELKQGAYDVVHRITPVSPTAPSYLAKKLKKLGIPFVVGPLNGGVPWPPEFRDLQHKEREWLSHIRSAYKLLPGYRSLRKNAACLIAGSMATKNDMPEYAKDKVLYLPENAVDLARFSLKNTSNYKLPIKAAFVGRLVPYKGADMAIEAMEHLCKSGQMTYDIYGSGPEEQALKTLVKNKGLEQWVTVHGFVPNTELQSKLVQADIFVFPSVREFGGGVVIESMALGVVPVIADYAGPSELVSSSTGYRVEMGSRADLIQNFRTQLEAICKDPESQLAPKRESAIAFIHNYLTWDKKTEQLMEIYNWVVHQGPKPEFNSPFNQHPN
ncbi:glycosyltransferase [Gynuella sp.]|uniref:glycosyltransferase n=1 Tax=Gynuella sp. TaxID=2969146 RepID=UPI003D0C7326